MTGIVKLIHADNFFPQDDANRLFLITKNLQFVEKQYGLEVDNFNLVFPGLDPVFSKVIGEEITVDTNRSGGFRRPMDCIIHFEEFELMEAFERLGANGEKVYLEFDPQLPRPNTKVRVRNDKEIIELKKTVTEDW